MMEDINDSPPKPPNTNESDDEKGWILYIGPIYNRRTVNDILIDMWRGGEDEWITNIGGVVQRTADAVQVVDFCSPIGHTPTSDSSSRFEIRREQLSQASPDPSPDNKGLQFYLWGRRALCFEKVYRSILYLAIHHHSLPSYHQSNTQLFREIFSQAQKAIDNCAELIPRWWYHHRHGYIWNILRSTFGAAVQIIAAVLGSLNVRRPGGGCWSHRRIGPRL